MSLYTPPRSTTGPWTRLGVLRHRSQRQVDVTKLADGPGARRGDVHELPGTEGQQGRAGGGGLDLQRPGQADEVG